MIGCQAMGRARQRGGLRGRPRSRMWCPHVIGRDGWVWVEQGALEERDSPHDVGEEALTGIEPPVVRILPVAFGPK